MPLLFGIVDEYPSIVGGIGIGIHLLLLFCWLLTLMSLCITPGQWLPSVIVHPQWVILTFPRADSVGFPGPSHYFVIINCPWLCCALWWFPCYYTPFQLVAGGWWHYPRYLLTRTPDGSVLTDPYCYYNILLWPQLPLTLDPPDPSHCGTLQWPHCWMNPDGLQPQTPTPPRDRYLLWPATWLISPQTIRTRFPFVDLPFARRLWPHGEFSRWRFADFALLLPALPPVRLVTVHCWVLVVLWREPPDHIVHVDYHRTGFPRRCHCLRGSVLIVDPVLHYRTPHGGCWYYLYYGDIVFYRYLAVLLRCLHYHYYLLLPYYPLRYYFYGPLPLLFIDLITAVVEWWAATPAGPGRLVVCDRTYRWRRTPSPILPRLDGITWPAWPVRTWDDPRPGVPWCGCLNWPDTPALNLCIVAVCDDPIACLLFVRHYLIVIPRPGFQLLAFPPQGSVDPHGPAQWQLARLQWAAAAPLQLSLTWLLSWDIAPFSGPQLTPTPWLLFRTVWLEPIWDQCCWTGSCYPISPLTLCPHLLVVVLTPSDGTTPYPFPITVNFVPPPLLVLFCIDCAWPLTLLYWPVGVIVIYCVPSWWAVFWLPTEQTFLFTVLVRYWYPVTLPSWTGMWLPDPVTTPFPYLPWPRHRTLFSPLFPSLLPRTLLFPLGIYYLELIDPTPPLNQFDGLFGHFVVRCRTVSTAQRFVTFPSVLCLLFLACENNPPWPCWTGFIVLFCLIACLQTGQLLALFLGLLIPFVGQAGYYCVWILLLYGIDLAFTLPPHLTPTQYCYWRPIVMVVFWYCCYQLPRLLMTDSGIDCLTSLDFLAGAAWHFVGPYFYCLLCIEPDLIIGPRRNPNQPSLTYLQLLLCAVDSWGFEPQFITVTVIVRLIQAILVWFLLVLLLFIIMDMLPTTGMTIPTPLVFPTNCFQSMTIPIPNIGTLAPGWPDGRDLQTPTACNSRQFQFRRHGSLEQWLIPAAAQTSPLLPVLNGPWRTVEDVEWLTYYCSVLDCCYTVGVAAGLLPPGNSVLTSFPCGRPTTDVGWRFCGVRGRTDPIYPTAGRIDYWPPLRVSCLVWTPFSGWTT